MSDKRRLVYSILKFCASELDSTELSDDSKESIEVAVQCLQSAYALNIEDKHLSVSKSLEQIFHSATQNEPLHKKGPVSQADKDEAERLKTEGNNLMRTEKFSEALQMYTKAIEIDGSNPVFYCNRAAAHSKMDNHGQAVEDCQRAVDMDPNYSKAYGRLGLAYSSMDRHKEAVENFKKALQLEPDNESYRSNLQIAEDKVQTLGSPGPLGRGGLGDLFPGLGAGGAGAGGPGGLNADFLQMAGNLMQDPNMHTVLSQIMGNMGLAGGQPGAGMPQGGSLESFLQAGQQLAQQMQRTNPELVEQLRRQMTEGANNPNNPPGSGGPNQQPPPPPPGNI